MNDYEMAFSLSPHTECLVFTPNVQSILSKIRYCIRARQGLSLILGDVGVGKSVLLRALYGEQAGSSSVKAALLTNSRFKTDLAFLKTICDHFGLKRYKAHVDQEAEFERFLIAEAQARRTVVLFLDEAQLLSAECLEVIRAILNFETSTQKLCQIVMAGQLNFGERLLQKRSKAIRSRIFAPSLINAMTLDEIHQLIEKRCEFWRVVNPFDANCIERMYLRTDGVPRHVLALAALVAEQGRAGTPITPDLVDVVADELIVKVHNEARAGGGDGRETEAANIR